MTPSRRSLSSFKLQSSPPSRLPATTSHQRLSKRPLHPTLFHPISCLTRPLLPSLFSAQPTSPSTSTLPTSSSLHQSLQCPRWSPPGQLSIITRPLRRLKSSFPSPNLSLSQLPGRRLPPLLPSSRPPRLTSSSSSSHSSPRNATLRGRPSELQRMTTECAHLRKGSKSHKYTSLWPSLPRPNLTCDRHLQQTRFTLLQINEELYMN